MKILRMTITVLFLFVIPLQGSKIYHNFRISRDLKKENRKKLKNAAEVLNECFDLNNKNKRTITDSMKLIEYCLKEY